MSKKYVIDLPDDAQYILINGASENHCYTRVEQVDDLEELNSDYINEHFGELQDEAYQRGLEDGKGIIGRGCDGCRYASKWQSEEPCKSCTNCYTNRYEPSPKNDDSIKVGDGVYEKQDDPRDFGVVTWVGKDSSYVMWKDGSSGVRRKKSLCKTGKHYDIQSILEAMRT